MKQRLIKSFGTLLASYIDRPSEIPTFLDEHERQGKRVEQVNFSLATAGIGIVCGIILLLFVLGFMN